MIDHDIQEPLKIDGDFDEIYNLASPASPKDFDEMPLFILRTSAIGHENLLKLATEKKARILFASTSEVYGDALEHPQRETYFGNVNTIGARSCYDEAKRYGEALSMTYHREFQTDIRIIRIFNTYGPRMNPVDGRIIPNFFSQALTKKPLTIYGDGSQTRSFCYVSDMTEGMYSIMQGNFDRPINIGNPIERTVFEMANIVNKLTSNDAGHEFRELPENDPKQRRPDISRAKEVLGWEPKVSLEDGLNLTLEYFQQAVLS